MVGGKPIEKQSHKGLVARHGIGCVQWHAKSKLNCSIWALAASTM